MTLADKCDDKIHKTQNVVLGPSVAHVANVPVAPKLDGRVPLDAKAFGQGRVGGRVNLGELQLAIHGLRSCGVGRRQFLAVPTPVCMESKRRKKKITENGYIKKTKIYPHQGA